MEHEQEQGGEGELEIDVKCGYGYLDGCADRRRLRIFIAKEEKRCDMQPRVMN